MGTCIVTNMFKVHGQARVHCCGRKGCHSWVLHAEWLRQLLEPALAATLDNDSEATAAASSALTALATLEGLLPGSLQSMMLEVTAPLGLHLEACKTCFAHRLQTHSIQAALRGCWCSAICCNIAGGNCDMPSRYFMLLANCRYWGLSVCALTPLLCKS